MKELTHVDKEGWKAELPLIKEHFATFGAKLPKALNDELAALEKRLGWPACRLTRFPLGHAHEQGKSVVAAGHELTAQQRRKSCKTAATPSTRRSPAYS